MATDPKGPLSFEEKFKQSADKAEKTMLPKLYNEAQFGKGQDFSAKLSNMAKYTTYGSKIYGKLGFDPRKNMDKIYHSNTTAGDEMWRAFNGAVELGGIGLQDTIALGAFASDKNYLDFDEIMASYQSNRKGTDFWANTLVSLGYTGGIILGIAAEEAALYGITALTGGAAAPATALEGAAVIGRGASLMAGGKKYLNAINGLTDLKTASQWLARTGAKTKKVLTSSESVVGFAKALNPLENTIDFVKNLDNIKEFNGLKQTVLGAGAMVRDARKITMSHSEAKLEADLAKKQFKENQIDLFRRNPENAGKEIPEEFLSDIDRRSEEVYSNIYAGNFGLIYLTNAITFDNMFKNMKSGSTHFANNFKISNLKKNGVKQVTVDYVKSGLIKPAIRELRALGTKKGLGSFVVKSSMEGIQELGQDVISNATKNYYGFKDPANFKLGFSDKEGFKETDDYDANINFQIDKNRGGFFDALFNEYTDAASDMVSKQGLETFVAGALMGVFANPVGYVTGRANSYIASGGIAKTKDRVFSNQKWRENKTTIEAQQKEKAKVLTKFFNEQGSFVDAADHPLFSQVGAQEGMLSAMVDNDEKKLKDNQDLAFVKGLKTLFQNNLQDEFISHLKYMGENFGVAELSEVFGRTDINEENKGEFQKKLLDRVEKVKDYRKQYDEINQSVFNPISIANLDPKDADYFDKLMEYKAYEQLKDEMLYSGAAIKDKAARMGELKNNLLKNQDLSSLEVDSILDEKAMGSQIQLLQSQVEANKNLKLTGLLAADAERVEKKLKAYKQYETALKAYKTIYNSDKMSGVDEAFDDLFEAYNDVVMLSRQLSNDEAQLPETILRAQNRKLFDQVYDYIALGEEVKFDHNFLSLINTPEGRSAYAQAKRDALISYDANKEQHIYNSLMAFEKGKQSDQMLAQLSEAGVFFDLNELDELVDKGIMPSRIYDLETSKPATSEQERKAQSIVAAFYKKLTGKKIIDASKAPSQAVKRTDDKRTLKGILRSFGIKLDTEYDLAAEKGPGSKLIDKVMSSPYLTNMDKEIISRLLDVKPKVMFVDTAELPVHVNKDGVVVMDVRFASSDFEGGILAFEHLIVTGLTQHKLISDLESNKELWTDAKNAMEQAKEAFAKNNPGIDVEVLDVFKDVNMFLSEALNDTAFQKFLASIDDNIQPESKSLWESLTSDIKKVINSSAKEGEEVTFENKLATRVFNIATKALDSSVVESVTETADTFEDLTEDESVIVTPETTPADVEEELATDETASAIDEQQSNLDALKTELADLTNQYNAIKASIDGGGLSFFKLRRAQSKLRDLSIKINDLTEQVKDSSETLVEMEQAISPIEEEYVSQFDIYGNEIITSQTPWQSIPKDLRELLATLLNEGPLNKLDAAQVQKIRENMLNNPVYISTVNDYVLKIQTAEELRLTEEQRIANENAIAAAQASKQPTTGRPKVTKSKKATTDDDIMRGILKGMDYSMLTPKEVEDLISQLKDKNQTIPFGPEDIIAYVKEKTYKKAMVDAKSKLAEDIAIAKEKKRNVERSLRILNAKSLRWYEGKKLKSLRISNATRKFIKAYHPEIFELGADEFIDKVRDIVADKKSLMINNYKDGMIRFTPGPKTATELDEIYKKLSENNQLYPEIVKNINRALYRANSPLRIKIKSRGKYTLGVKSPSEIRSKSKMPKGEYAKKKEVVLDAAEYNSTAAIAAWFLSNKIHPDVIVAMYGVDAQKEVDAKTALLSKGSKFKTVSGIVDAVHETVRKLDVGDGTNDGFFEDFYDFGPEVEDFLQSFFTPAQMVEHAYKAVSINEQGGEQESPQEFEEFYDTEEGQKYLEKNAKDEADYIMFLNSEAGKTASSDEKTAEDEYHSSKAFAIESGSYEGNFEDLTVEEQRAFDYARSLGYYADVYVEPKSETTEVEEPVEQVMTSPTGVIKNQLAVDALRYSTPYNHLKAVMKSLTGDKQSDAAYAAGVYKFANESEFLTDKNKQKVIATLKSNYDKGSYNDTYIVMNENVYQIQSSTDGLVQLQNLSTLKLMQIPVIDLLANTQQTLNEGETYNNINVDLVVNKQEIAYIKSVYQDIFNNFDSLFTSTKDTAANEAADNKLLSLLTKCK